MSTTETPRTALIHDLAIVLAGSLHPSAQIGPSPRLAARRMQDVLGIEDGALTKDIEARIGEALGSEDEPAKAARFADFYSVMYGNLGSGARALTVITDEPMQVRPVSDRKVIIAHA